MSTWLHDLRFAFRTLRKSPGYAATTIFTIAVALGANTALFSFLDGVLLKPLPNPDPDRIVQVLEKRPDGGRNGVSTLNYLDWAKQNDVFEYMAARTGWTATLSGGDGEPTQLQGNRVSAHFFDVFGVTPALGRAFLPGEDEPGNDHVVMLSHSLWENRFGADPSLVGRTITLDGEPYTVVGVFKEGPFDRSFVQIWKPLSFEPANMTRDFHWFAAYAKLKPGVTLDQARAQMDVIGKRIAEQYPDSNKGWGVSVDRYADMVVAPELRTAVIVLFAATGFVLLIACANLANLALARGLSRDRDVAVRASLGAGRWRLARQFLTENVVLAAAGGVLGIGVGYATMRWIESLLPPFTLPAQVSVEMDMRVMLFAMAAALATGLLFGLAPAVQATRTNLAGTMKEGGRGTTGGAGRRLRDVLVVAEVGLAFVLLVGSGLLMRSFFRILDVDTGFDSTNVLTAGLPIAQARHPDPVELNAYLRSIRAAVDAVPGVRESAMTSALPLQGWGYGMPFQVAGRQAVDRAHRDGGFFKMVSPSYFHTLGIRVIKGRALNDRDTSGSVPVTVINETLAKRVFPDENPIGQHLLVQKIIPGKTQLGPDVSWEIVGVIADEKISGLDDQKSGGLYVSNEQSPVYGVSLVVRGTLDPERLRKAIVAAVASVDKDQALAQIRTLEQIEAQSTSGRRIETVLFGLFAGIALLLAGLGLYGVLSYSVAQRAQELGIRAALGAGTSNLLSLALGSGMRLTLIGLALGLAGSLAVTRVVASLLYGVGARDPLTMVAVAAVLAAVGAAACLVPALRAARADPMKALRFE